MRVAVDDELCVGHGQCVRCAPAVFGQNLDDGRVILLDSAPPADLHAAVREAGRFCPSGAIEFFEDE